MSQPAPALLPLPAMARQLRVSRRWLREEAEAGRLPCVKVGASKYLFAPPVVEAALFGSRVPLARIGRRCHVKLDTSDIDSLRPLIRIVVQDVLAEIEAAHNKVNGALGYTEAEAATLIGVAPHVLRDCRLRGEIAARKVGCRYIYPRQSLISYLNNGAES